MMADHKRHDTFAQMVILSLVIFLAGLLGLVIVIALIQKTLDATGVVTVLAGSVTGITGGFMMRYSQNKRNGDSP